MRHLQLNEAELELLVEALETLRLDFTREPPRRDDVTMVSAIDNMLERLQEAGPDPAGSAGG